MVAQLLLINNKSNTLLDNRAEGDIVGIFDASHVFSKHEKKIFDIVEISGTQKEISLSLPEVKVQLKETETGEAWIDDEGNVRRLITRPRFQYSYSSISKSIKNNISRFPENLTAEIVPPGKIETIGEKS